MSATPTVGFPGDAHNTTARKPMSNVVDSVGVNSPTTRALLLNHPLVDREQLKVAVLHFIVNVVGFAVFIAIWLNYVLLQPYFSTLFWAAALSVPLHALKRLVVSRIRQELALPHTRLVPWLVKRHVQFGLQFVVGRTVYNIGVTLLRAYFGWVRSLSRGSTSKSEPVEPSLVEEDWHRTECPCYRESPTTPTLGGGKGSAKRKENPVVQEESVPYFNSFAGREFGQTPLFRFRGVESRVGSATDYRSTSPANPLCRDPTESIPGSTKGVTTVDQGTPTRLPPTRMPGSTLKQSVVPHTPTLMGRPQELEMPRPVLEPQPTTLFSPLAGSTRDKGKSHFRAQPLATNLVAQFPSGTNLPGSRIPSSPLASTSTGSSQGGTVISTTSLATPRTPFTPVQSNVRIIRKENNLAQYSVKRRFLDRISPIIFRTPNIPPFTFGDQFKLSTTPWKSQGKSSRSGTGTPSSSLTSATASGLSTAGGSSRIVDSVGVTTELNQSDITHGWVWIAMVVRLSLVIVLLDVYQTNEMVASRMTNLALSGVLFLLAHITFHILVKVGRDWVWYNLRRYVWIPGQRRVVNYVDRLGPWQSNCQCTCAISENQEDRLPPFCTPRRPRSLSMNNTEPVTSSQDLPSPPPSSTMVSTKGDSNTSSPSKNPDGVTDDIVHETKDSNLSLATRSPWLADIYRNGYYVLVTLIRLPFALLQQCMIVVRLVYHAVGYAVDFIHGVLKRAVLHYLNEVVTLVLIVGIVLLVVLGGGFLLFKTVDEVAQFVDDSYQLVNAVSVIGDDVDQLPRLAQVDHPWLSQNLTGLSEALAHHLIVLSLTIKEELSTWLNLKLKEQYPDSNVTASEMYERFRKQYASFKGITPAHSILPSWPTNPSSLPTQTVDKNVSSGKYLGLDIGGSHFMALRHLGSIVGESGGLPLALKPRMQSATPPHNLRIHHPPVMPRMAERIVRSVTSHSSVRSASPQPSPPGALTNWGVPESTLRIPSVASNSLPSSVEAFSSNSTQCSPCDGPPENNSPGQVLSCARMCSSAEHAVSAWKILYRAVTTADISRLVTSTLYWRALQEGYTWFRARMQYRYLGYHHAWKSVKRTVSTQLHRLGNEMMRAFSLGLLTLLHIFTVGFDVLFQTLLFFFTLYSLVVQDQSVLHSVGRILVFVDRGQRLRWAVERSIGGIFVCSLQMALFHICWTWVTLRCWDIHTLLYTSAFVSGVIAVVPMVTPWVVAVPPAVWFLAQGQILNGVSLLGAHILVVWVVDPIFYASIPDTNPFFAALSILLGLWAFGPQGLLLGPLAMTCLPAAYQLLGEVIMGQA
ncbi:hypothetical protein IWQ61_001134 [Dispira simplex]|nr:hypothetical protein IWQ61_001134 [Dispira simplex]